MSLRKTIPKAAPKDLKKKTISITFFFSFVLLFKRLKKWFEDKLFLKAATNELRQSKHMRRSKQKRRKLERVRFIGD